MQLISAAEQGDLESLGRELAAGTPVDTHDPRTGWTPLIAAATSVRANEQTLRLLLAAGADVNARSWTPDTAPAEAAALTIPESQEYSWNGTTALLQAASTGDLARVRVLLDAGADVAATTTHGYDALINAVYSSQKHSRLHRSSRFCWSAVPTHSAKQATARAPFGSPRASSPSMWSSCCLTLGPTASSWAGIR